MSERFQAVTSLTLVFALLVTAFVWTNTTSENSQVTPASLAAEEQRIKERVREYLGQASAVEVHPQSLRIHFSSETEEESSLYVLERGGRLVLSTGNDEFALSSPDVQVADLWFANNSTENNGQIAMQFALSPAAHNSGSGRLNQRAAIFDSPLLPVPDSSISLGSGIGDVDRINNTIFFDANAARVGLSGNASDQTDIKLKVHLGGIQMTSNSATLPTCDLGKRGTIWMAQPGGSTPDNFSVCLRSATGTMFWAEYSPL